VRITALDDSEADAIRAALEHTESTTVIANGSKSGAVSFVSVHRSPRSRRSSQKPQPRRTEVDEVAPAGARVVHVAAGSPSPTSTVLSEGRK
jgi:hypothetical protein